MFPLIGLTLLIPLAIFMMMGALAVFLARQLTHEHLSKKNIALVFVVVLGSQLAFTSYLASHPFSTGLALLLLSLFVSTALGMLYGVYSSYRHA